MADEKLSQLTPLTGLALTDVAYGVKTPGGTPSSGQMVLTDLLTLFLANMGTMAQQNANNVSITGGSVAGVTMTDSGVDDGTF